METQCFLRDALFLTYYVRTHVWGRSDVGDGSVGSIDSEDCGGVVTLMPYLLMVAAVGYLKLGLSV